MTEDRSIIFGIPDKVEGNTYNAENKGTVITKADKV